MNAADKFMDIFQGTHSSTTARPGLRRRGLGGSVGAGFIDDSCRARTAGINPAARQKEYCERRGLSPPNTLPTHSLPLVPVDADVLGLAAAGDDVLLAV